MDYRTEDGNLIEEWYLSQNEIVQAEFDTILNILAGTENWGRLKQVMALSRKHRGLHEIRFRVGDVRYRPVGFFSLNYREFILLMGCEKRAGIYSPSKAFDLALVLKCKFVAGKGSIHEHTI
ncbi:MAG: hypothetical protein O6837_10660 [Deltaproteobacteria bacterium]|nr:hypothetical protein [Deltaproteobacteria bacterium]